MVVLNSCPICGNKNTKAYNQVGLSPHVKHEIVPGMAVNAVIVSSYSICDSCNVIFQNPRLSDAELNKLYSQGYYRLTINLTEEEIDRDEKYRSLVDAQIIKKKVGHVLSHLDIGCSHGSLLEAVWADIKVGVDKNTNWPMVKGIKIYRDIGKVSQKSFDLVTAIHVLEHVPDPKLLLTKMKNKLSSDGYLIVEVPSWKSPGGPLRLAHLYHFEPDVLRLMCKEVGLKVIDTEFTPHLMLICVRE